MQVVYDYLREQMLNAQFHPKVAIYMAAIGTFLILSLIALILFFPFRKILLTIIERFTRHTETLWDDVLFDHKVFHAVAHLIPAIFVYASAGFGSEDLVALPAFWMLARISIIPTLSQRNARLKGTFNWSKY